MAKKKTKKKENNMIKYIMLGLYLVLTISGLVLYKKGANQDFLINITSGVFNLKISLISLIGLLCYVGSFLIYMLILPSYDLTFIYPILTGISYVGIFLLSIFILGEAVSLIKIIGVVFILIGIVIMNIK